MLLQPRRDDGADPGVLERRAVPPPRLELVLALLDRVPLAVDHALHEVRVHLAELELLADEHSLEVVARDSRAEHQRAQRRPAGADVVPDDGGATVPHVAARSRRRAGELMRLLKP